MKTFLFIYYLAIINFSILVSGNAKNTSIKDFQITKVVFDGHEGNYFFFTDQNSKALQLEVKDHPLLSDQKFKNGDYIGKSFILTIKSDDKTNSQEKGILSISLIH